MDRTIEVNGKKYVQQDADFNQQVMAVTSLLGDEMYDALSEARAIIAGGAVLSAFTQQETNDVDVYFPSMEAMAKAFVRVTKDWDTVYLGHTNKSITIKDKESDAIVQFIYFDYFRNAEAVFEAFDFTVCMGALEMNPDLEKSPELVLHPSFLTDVASRTLHFNRGTRFPYISLVRTKKYQERGFKIGRGHLIAIALACAETHIESWDQAKEQLGGIYGNEIDLEIKEDTPFTQEKLHEVVTNLQEHKFMSLNLTKRDYNTIFKQITGQEYNTYIKDIAI